MARDAEDGALVLRDLARGDEFLGTGHGDTAGRFGKNTGIFGQQLDALDDLLVGGVLTATAGLTHGADRIVAVGRGADGKRLGNGVGILDRLDDVGAGLEGGADRRASGGLRSVDGEVALLHDAEVDEFLVGLVDLGQERSRGHTGHCVARELPAELLGDLEAHGLRTLRVVGAEIHVHEAPAVLAGDFGTETVHLVIGAGDTDDVGAVDERPKHLTLLEIGRDEHVALQSRIGGIGGNGVSQIARGSAGHHLKAELTSTAERDGDHTVLEGEGRVVDRVVFDPELADAELLGEAVGLHQRSEPHLRADGRLPVDRKKLAVTPHCLGA